MNQKQESFAPYFAFVVATLGWERTDEDLELIVRFLSSDFDIEFLVDYGYRHGLTPLMYKKLQKLHPNHPLTLALAPVYYSIAQNNIAMTSHLLRLAQKFKHNGIPLITFKGPSLAVDSYGDITLRSFGDIDILVMEGDMGRGVEVMEGLGYVSTLGGWSGLEVVGLLHEESQILIELHHRLTSQKYALPWERLDLWTECQTVTINGHPLTTLSHEIGLLYLALHGSKHLYIRLSWIVDIDRFIRTHGDIDWERVVRMARKMGVYRSVAVSVRLAWRLHGTPLPTAITRDKGVEYIIEQILIHHYSTCTSTMGGLKRLELLMRLRDGWYRRFMLLTHLLFTPEQSDLETIRLPRTLRGLYPLVRLGRLIGKSVRRYFTSS